MTIIHHRGATGGDRSPHQTDTQTHMGSTTPHRHTRTDWTSLSDLVPNSPVPPTPPRPSSCDSDNSSNSIYTHSNSICSNSNSSNSRDSIYSTNCGMSSICGSSSNNSSDNSTSSSPYTSSDDSCGPPSPPSEYSHNYSGTGTLVLPPGEESSNQFQEDQLVDLGHENVAKFFLHNTRTVMADSKVTRVAQREGKKETGPVPLPRTTSTVKKQHKSDKPKPKPSTRTAGGRKLWEFVLGLLCNPKYNPSIVRWLDIHQGMFMFVQSRDAASLWGQRRGHPTMTYEHMSRAIRHYYRGQVILRVPGKRLVYKFGPNAHAWRERVCANSTGPLADQIPTDLCLNLPQSSTVSGDSPINSPSCDNSLDESPTYAASPEVTVAMDSKDNNGVTMATAVNKLVVTTEGLTLCDSSAMYDAPMDVVAMPMVTRNQVSMTTDSVQKVPGETTEWLNYLHSDNAQQYSMADMTTYKSLTTTCIVKTEMPDAFDPLDLEFQTGFYEGAMGSDTTYQRPLVMQTTPSIAVPELPEHKPILNYDNEMAGGVMGGFTLKQEAECEIPQSVFSQIEDILQHEQLQDLEENMWMETAMYTASVCTDWC